MPRIVLVQGDITEQTVDAVVNAANKSLLGGGGAEARSPGWAARPSSMAGRRLRAERYPDRLPTGQAAAMPAGRLPWVIHTVRPVCSPREDRSARLESRHVEALRIADAPGCGSVAFPAISTGVHGYPLGRAAPVAVGAARAAATRVAEVRLVLFYSSGHAPFERALGGRRPQPVA